jgi:hypothetical protein
VPDVYAQADWYRERPEREAEWRGVLRRRDVPVGPATRSALAFVFVAEGREVDVYAASAERSLEPFVDRRVVARGKIVDLSGEGYGMELWLASIAAEE